MKYINIFLLIVIYTSILTQDLTNIMSAQFGNIALIFSIIYLIINITYYKIRIPSFLIIIILFLFIMSFISVTFINPELIAVLRLLKVNSIILFILLGYVINEVYRREYIIIFAYVYLTFLVIIFLQNISRILTLTSETRIFEMDFLFFTLQTGNLFFCGLVISLMMSIIIYRTEKFNKVILYLTIFLTLLLIITSLVRTAYVMLLVVFLYFFIIKNLKDNRRILSLIGLIIFSGLIMIFVQSDYFDRILYTFGNQSGSALDASSSIRLELFMNIIVYLFSNPLYFLFGTGFMEFYEINLNTLGLNSSHNGFLNIFLKGGIFYLLLLLSFIIFAFKNIKINKTEFMIITLLFIFSNLTGDGINYLMISQIYFLYLGLNIRKELI